MNNNQSNKSETVEINIFQIFTALWHRIWALILAAVIFGAAAFFATYLFITPKYRSSVLMYVNNSSLSIDSASISISPSELTAAQSLVDTYIVILETRTTLNEVIARANLDYSYGQLKEMISSSAVNSTEIFEVVVTGTDPEEAKLIANTIAEVLPDKIVNIVEGSSVRIVDYAVTPTSKSSPSYSKNVMIGIILGLVLSAGLIIVLEMFDVLVRSEQYLAQNFNIPVLAVIPDMRNPGAGGKYYKKYYRKTPYYKNYANEYRQEDKS